MQTIKHHKNLKFLPTFLRYSKTKQWLLIFAYTLRILENRAMVTELIHQESAVLFLPGISIILLFVGIFAVTCCCKKNNDGGETQDQIQNNYYQQILQDTYDQAQKIIVQQNRNRIMVPAVDNQLKSTSPVSSQRHASQMTPTRTPDYSQYLSGGQRQSTLPSKKGSASSGYGQTKQPVGPRGIDYIAPNLLAPKNPNCTMGNSSIMSSRRTTTSTYEPGSSNYPTNSEARSQEPNHTPAAKSKMTASHETMQRSSVLDRQMFVQQANQPSTMHTTNMPRNFNLQPHNNSLIETQRQLGRNSNFEAQRQLGRNSNVETQRQLGRNSRVINPYGAQQGRKPSLMDEKNDDGWTNRILNAGGFPMNSKPYSRNTSLSGHTPTTPSGLRLGAQPKRSDGKTLNKLEPQTKYTFPDNNTKSYQRLTASMGSNELLSQRGSYEKPNFDDDNELEDHDMGEYLSNDNGKDLQDLEAEVSRAVEYEKLTIGEQKTTPMISNSSGKANELVVSELQEAAKSVSELGNKIS